MPSLPHSLIRHYDSIGWIPTIRGCLSLDLIDKAKCILGDVDKYSVRFKQYYGLESAHYLIATSLNTVNELYCLESILKPLLFNVDDSSKELVLSDCL